MTMKNKYSYELGISEGFYLRYSIINNETGGTYTFYTSKYGNDGLFTKLDDGTFKQWIGLCDFSMNVSKSTQRKILLKKYESLQSWIEKEGK